MSLRVFLNRLFRRAQWARALGMEPRAGRRLLRRRMALAEEESLLVIAEMAGTPESAGPRPDRLSLHTDRLAALLPFATDVQAAKIQAALDIAGEAAQPVLPRNAEPPGIPFYSVYIPTLDGRFYYLSTTDYPPGEIVLIPYGPEDREICGIVESCQRFPYNKTPLPMWKMKYILGRSPEPIAELYRRLRLPHASHQWKEGLK